MRPGDSGLGRLDPEQTSLGGWGAALGSEGSTVYRESQDRVLLPYLLPLGSQMQDYPAEVTK